MFISCAGEEKRVFFLIVLSVVLFPPFIYFFKMCSSECDGSWSAERGEEMEGGRKRAEC